MAHGDDRLFVRFQAVTAAESLFCSAVRAEKVRVHAVGQAVHRLAQAISRQQAAGVGRGRQHHIPKAVAEGDPAAEQGREQVAAPEGAAEVLHGGVAVPHHLPSPEAGQQRRRHRVRQDGIDMDGVGVRREAVGDGHSALGQAVRLMADGLSHAAAAYQLFAAAIEVNRHGILLYMPVTQGRSRQASVPGCTGRWQRACTAG